VLRRCRTRRTCSGNADVRVVDVAIDDVGDDLVGMVPVALGIREPAQLEERSLLMFQIA
jgi:hypothetical protein